MPSFGRITGRVRKNATNFRQRIERIVEKQPASADGNETSSTKALLNSTSKFLSSFGAEAKRLNRLSKERLSDTQVTESQKLRDRAVAEITTNSKAELANVVDTYARGRINLSTLKLNVQKIMREGAIAAMVVGATGLGNTSENVITAVQRALTAQFNTLDVFMNELRTREINQRDKARFQLYAQNAFAIAEVASRQVSLDTFGENSDLEERRVLGGSEHCEDCEALAAEGWVPAGTLPPIGSGTLCGQRCNCTIVVRSGEKQIAVRYNTEGERIFGLGRSNRPFRWKHTTVFSDSETSEDE